jgi:hypothetical protein
MAAATRPGPADARVPCPLCGGLIHPIAGRCKHCKEDLRTLRGARPAAVATLPALGQPLPMPQVTGTGNGAANSNGNEHATATATAPVPATNGYYPASAQPQPQPQSLIQQFAAAAPAPLSFHQSASAGPIEAVPILPPRPTGRFVEAAPRASWKSWPVIVIILAAIAIITAVVLMLFPPGGADTRDEGTNRSLLPAPDRMDTKPTPTPRQPPSKSTDPDPWSRGGGTTPKTPPSAQVTPPDDPDIDDPDVDDAITRDPFSRRGTGGLGGRGAGGLGGLGGLGPPRPNMLYSIIKHACTRLASCSGADVQTKALCDLYSRVPATAPSCSAATRCLRSIDNLSCDDLGTDSSSLWELKDKLTECTDAMSC